MKDIKKNFIYNTIYQILILVIPLVTIPYVSRVIGAEGIGIYSYTYSIAYYFMLFAMLGLNNYGNRIIAQVRDDKKELSKYFKEIYFMQIFTSSIVVLLYLFYTIFFDIQYKDISIMQSLYIISCMFDINWFFFGIEKFKLTITRSTILRFLSLILIFIFVRDSNDIWIYTLILSGSTLLSQIIIFPFLKKYVDNVKVNVNDILKHFIPCLKLFLPVIATAIYKIMDKTMLGIMSNVTEVGFYENAEKITNVPIAIISAMGTVMLPRMSNLYAKGADKESQILIYKSIKFIMFLSFAMMFGMIAVSKDFTNLFLGNGFVKCSELVIYLSITIVFLSWGNVIRTQYLIPKEKDKEYIISAFIGAFINFIINLILIPKYKSIGACIGTVVAEFVVVSYQSFKIKNELPIKQYLLEILPFFIKAFTMFIIILFIKYLNLNAVVTILLQVLFGMIIYFILNYKYIINLLKH